MMLPLSGKLHTAAHKGMIFSNALLSFLAAAYSLICNANFDLIIIRQVYLCFLVIADISKRKKAKNSASVRLTLFFAPIERVGVFTRQTS